nr:A30 [uncultured bacterium]
MAEVDDVAKIEPPARVGDIQPAAHTGMTWIWLAVGTQSCL